ncbi:hypothetical protein KA078_03840 [Candidatus Woesebacteria bacterium]|nr:hypothetical protein [Candidatus Woesebacteria bacterium]
MGKKNSQDGLDKLEAVTEIAAQDGSALFAAQYVIETQERALEATAAKVHEQADMIKKVGGVVKSLLQELEGHRSKKRFEEQKASNMAAAMKMPLIAKWPLLQEIAVNAAGMEIVINPSRWDRTVESHSDLDDDGDVVKTVSILKGEGFVLVNLGVFGMVNSRAILIHTETDYGGNTYVDIVNSATFSMTIEGIERFVSIEARGLIAKLRTVGIEESAQITVTPVACGTCGDFHDKNNVAVHPATITIY